MLLKHRWMNRSLCLLAVFGLGFLTPMAQAAGVGEVIFTVGTAQLQGSSSPVKRGMSVEVGQTFITGPNGHVHIRFIDDAFVSLRPSSELRIDQYVYDATKAQNNRVKFTLVQGTSRLITGKAGQAAKQNFRLNTPVAAIGIRGTDFVVQTSGDLSRVAVHQGAVVMSSFEDGCTAASLGACSGRTARDLMGSLTNQYLEVKSAQLPQLIKPSAGAAGKLFAPAAPEEPSVGVSTSGDKSVGSRLPTGLQGSDSIVWGRWSSAQAPQGYELVAREDNFALFRSLGEVNLPKTGNVAMSLVSSETYARDLTGNLEAAEIKNPSLIVNFGSMQYATRFQWVYGNQVKALSSKGSITDAGYFVANPNLSNMDMAGALNNSGNEAGYIFSKYIQGKEAIGITQWKR